MSSCLHAVRITILGSFALGILAGTASSMTVPVGTIAVGLTVQSEYGTIKGRLVWGGDEVPVSKPLVEQSKAPKDPEVCAKDGAILSRELAIDPKTKGIAHAFVFLTRPKGTNDEAVKSLVAKSPKLELDQKNCEFAPYSLAIHQDQTLVLKSSDAVNHNVRYAAFTNAPFNMILPPNGTMEVKLVAERRPIVVLCDIHSWMKAYVMVFDHPFFAVTGPDGSFEIKGVPAGSQNLVVWQEKVGYVNPEKAKGIPLVITAGQTRDAGDIKLDPSQIK